MSAALLDVNVLVALLDPSHVHHDGAHQWFAANGRRPWATCPITANGCIRVLSHPNHPTLRATPGDVMASLRVLCSKPSHEFWPDDISLLDEARCRPSKIAGPGQWTDIYLLALAVSRHGRLVTFDESIPRDAVPGAIEINLEILGAKRRPLQ